jgi:AbrB family looped-hinge helix DNA binding protein
MHTATLSAKYQLCIPKPVREQLHLQVGQQFVFIAKGNSLHLVPKRNMDSIRGLLKGANTNNVRDRKDRV